MSQIHYAYIRVEFLLTEPNRDSGNVNLGLLLTLSWGCCRRAQVEKKNTESKRFLCFANFSLSNKIPWYSFLDSPTSGFVGNQRRLCKLSQPFPAQNFLQKKHWFRAPGLCFLMTLILHSKMRNRQRERSEGQLIQFKMNSSTAYSKSVPTSDPGLKMWALEVACVSLVGQEPKGYFCVFFLCAF